MTSAQSSADQYSQISVSIHWATAVLVIAAYRTDLGATKVVLLRFCIRVGKNETTRARPGDHFAEKFPSCIFAPFQGL